MNPSVSIIVPVYNAQKTIARCIESIINQEFQDFELLLVNDGSKDDSGQICDSYAAQDKRIRVIHKDNSGVSDSRNMALDLAKGKYIQFLDSDDWITTDATNLFFRAAEDHHCDMVISDFYRVVGQRVSHKGDIDDDAVMTREDYAAHMMENPADFYYGVLWNKLYRRAIFAQLRYPEGKLNEDFFLIPEVCLRIQKAVVVPKALYYYVQRGGSIMSGNKTLRHFDAAEAAQRYWDCLVENEVYDALANAAKFTMGSVSRVYRQLPHRHCARHPAAGKCCGCSLMWSTAPGGTAPSRAGFGCKAGCCGTSRRHTADCGNSRAEEKEKNA